MVEGTGLENRRAVKGTVGSNPTLSAKYTCGSVMIITLPCDGENGSLILLCGTTIFGVGVMVAPLVICNTCKAVIQ